MTVAAKKRQAQPANTIRIIGGQWRGRKLKFANRPSLRPTPNRIRETLFNWLAPSLNGLRCLDLFAGSGALGLEALSRRANHVTFIETNKHSIRYLTQHLTQLNAQNLARVQASDAFEFIRQDSIQPFDVVFLDPPFQQNIVEPICQALEHYQRLNPGAKIYVEAESALQSFKFPAAWSLVKNQQAGQVYYGLLVKDGI